MFKQILKIIFFTFMLKPFVIQAMEQIPENWDSANNWEKAKLEGPLKELNFQETEHNDNGKHYGWLYAKESEDHVFVAVSLHPSGYYIDYVDPQYKISLPNEFYYWKWKNRIKMNPYDNLDYVVKEVSWSSIPVMIPMKEYDESLPYDSVQNKEYHKAAELINKTLRANRYQLLPSFKEAFKDCCSKVYLFEKIKPIELKEWAKGLIEHKGHLYMDFDEEEKLKILTLLPDNVYEILKSWLEEKVKNTGLWESSPEYKNSIGYVMNKNRVIDQFIIEAILKYVILIEYLKKTEYINTYKILEDIESLEPCSVEMRKETEEELLERFESWNSRRILGITAKGIINCNPGLLQWD